MVMGMIRTAYRTRIRLFPGDPTTYPVRWYRAPKKAKLFPGAHFGLSRDWFNYRPDFGEVPGAKRHYDSGENVRHTKGQCFRGQQEWFRTGVDLSTLVGQTVSVDRCTSCPGLGPRLGISASSTMDEAWWVIGLQAFLPYVMRVVLGNTVGGAADGPYDAVYNPAFGIWLWDVPCGAPLASDLALRIVAGFGVAVTNTGGTIIWATANMPTSLNPFTWSNVAAGGTGCIQAGTTFNINSPLVTPHYYEPGRSGVVFGPLNNRSDTRLSIGPLGGPYTPPGGPSGFDGGYDDGYGGD
jgi:hypothetical protein